MRIEDDLLPTTDSARVPTDSVDARLVTARTMPSEIVLLIVLSFEGTDASKRLGEIANRAGRSSHVCVLLSLFKKKTTNDLARERCVAGTWNRRSVPNDGGATTGAGTPRRASHSTKGKVRPRRDDGRRIRTCLALATTRPFICRQRLRRYVDASTT